MPSSQVAGAYGAGPSRQRSGGRGDREPVLLTTWAFPGFLHGAPGTVRSIQANSTLCAQQGALMFPQ